MIARIGIGIVFLAALVAGIVYVGRAPAPADRQPPVVPATPAPEADSTASAPQPAPTADAAAPAAAVVEPGPSADEHPTAPTPPVVVAPDRDPADRSAVQIAPAPAVDAGLHALVFSWPSAEQPVNYLLFLPKAYRDGRRWPVIFYLHGRSLSGDDPAMLTKYGLPRIVSRDPAFPFIVVAPQCRAGKRWTDIDTLNALLGDVLAHYPADPDRVYLTGYSMGAGGAWRLGGARPELFAAVAALAGVGGRGAVKGLARVPVWAFHGTDDASVPASASEAMVTALRAAGGDARLELIPGRGHDIVDVYDRPDLYAWFLAHTRRR